MGPDRPGSTPEGSVELLADQDVKKLGMVCALPPKPLEVRQLAPGGWAEQSGVMLGDLVVEVNGTPADSLVAEDLKQAMSSRPLHLRLALTSPARLASGDADVATTAQTSAAKLACRDASMLPSSMTDGPANSTPCADTTSFHQALGRRKQASDQDSNRCENDPEASAADFQHQQKQASDQSSNHCENEPEASIADFRHQTHRSSNASSTTESALKAFLFAHCTQEEGGGSASLGSSEPNDAVPCSAVTPPGPELKAPESSADVPLPESQLEAIGGQARRSSHECIGPEDQEDLLRWQAALMIQAALRRCLVRRSRVGLHHETEESEMNNMSQLCELQAVPRTSGLEDDAVRASRASITIQSALRGSRTRKLLRSNRVMQASNESTFHQAAIVIESMLRRYEAGMLLLELKKESQRETVRLNQTAALTLQSAWRGYWARKLLVHIDLEEVGADAPWDLEHEAACIIQSVVRGWRVRKSIDEVLRSNMLFMAPISECCEGMSNETGSTPGTEEPEAEARNCEEGFSSGCDSVHGCEDIDDMNWLKDRDTVATKISNPAAPVRSTGEGRAMPGFSLDPPEDMAENFGSLRKELQEAAPAAKTRGRQGPGEAPEPPPSLEDVRQASLNQGVVRRSPLYKGFSPIDVDADCASEESWDAMAEQSIEGSLSCYEGPTCNAVSDNPAIVEAFKVVLARKAHGLVRGWRNVLDLCGRGRVTFSELCDCCRRLGFRGSIKDLWRQLDPDDLGGVTLQDLDYDAAEALSKFHCALIGRYGSVRAATKAFSVTGARRLQQKEFCKLLRSHGFMRKQEARGLFDHLCTCPPASSLDRDSGVSVRDFEWLQNVSKYLPDIVVDHLQPGVSPGCLELYDLPEVSSDSEDEAVSNAGSTIFENLYQRGMDGKERRHNLTEQQVTESELRGPVDPHRFERLFREGQAKKEQMERRTEDYYQQNFPQKGAKQLSGEVWERLNKPKEKAMEEEFVIRVDRSTCFDAIPVAQIRSACEQEGCDTKNKTKEELLDFLKHIKQREAPKAVPKASLRMEKLYKDHQRQLLKQEKTRREVAAKEEKEIQDLQMKPSRGPNRNLHERLYREAEVAERRRNKNAEISAAKLETELAELHKQAKAPARMETFYRLYTDGQDKQEKISEKKRRLEIEEEKLLKRGSIHKDKAADPRVYDRLYNRVRRGDEPPDAGESVADDGSEVYDPSHEKIACRPTQQELKVLLQKKIETVEEAQRRSICSVGGDAALPGMERRGAGSSSKPSILTRSSTPPPLKPLTSKNQTSGRVTCQRNAPGDPPRPSESGLLRDFAKFFFGCFPNVDVAVNTFDMGSKSGRFNLPAFLAGVKRLRYNGDAQGVFRALDIDCIGAIGKSELLVLNRFHPHPTADLEIPTSSGKGGSKAKVASLAPGQSTSHSQLKTRSSSNPNLYEVDCYDVPPRARQLLRPGESDVQPLHLQMQNAESGYKYKGWGRSKIPNTSTAAERTDFAPSQIPRPQKGIHRSQDQDGAAKVLACEARAAELAACSRYPYKGRANDAQPHGRRLSSSSSHFEEVSSNAGKDTPCFGELGAKRWHQACDTSTDAGSRTTEVPVVCDDELLIAAHDDGGGESDSSSGTVSRVAHSVSDYNPTASCPDTAPESPESSARSTPRGTDIMLRAAQLGSPQGSWGTGHDDATASSSGVTAHPWRSAHALQTKKVAALGPADDDLQAEVRELLMQYKIEKDRSATDMERRPSTGSGPELSSKSAWIHPEPQQA